MSEELTIKIKKEQIWMYTTFILAAILIIGAFMTYGKTSNSVPSANDGQAAAAGGAAAAPSKVDVAIGDAPMLGSKSAKVTIVEYSDFQCPFCRKFFSETYSQIKKDYVDTGKVKIYFKEFPLSSLHPMAQKSAEAALCVKDKGGDAAFYKMHDKMFEEQNKLDGGDALVGPVKSTVSYTTDDLKAWAKSLGYDISSCLDSDKFASKVAAEETEGASYGVQGTPAFFINGQLLSGAYPYASFKQIIDAELAK